MISFLESNIVFSVLLVLTFNFCSFFFSKAFPETSSTQARRRREEKRLERNKEREGRGRLNILGWFFGWLVGYVTLDIFVPVKYGSVALTFIYVDNMLFDTSFCK